MENILIFTDCDFDDTTAISILLCQHIQKKINILGIVCEDGFLTFPDNICWISKWLSLNKVSGIPIVKGLSPTPYLLKERKFPTNWIFAYKKMLIEKYNVDFQELPPYQDLETFLPTIRNTSFLVNLLAPVRSYGILLRESCDFRKMRSNATLGNLVEDGTSSSPDRTYNAFLDPDGLRDYLLFSKCPSLVFNATYNDTTFSKTKLDFYRTEAKKYILDPHVAVQLKFIFNKTMQFLQNFLNSESRDIDIKLWDVITTFLLLQYPMKQKSVHSNLLVSWTGKTQIESTNSYKKCCGLGGKNIGSDTNSFIKLNGKDFDKQFVMRFFT